MLNLFKRREESKGNLVCDYCRMEFPDRSHLEKHKKIAHAKGR